VVEFGCQRKNSMQMQTALENKLHLFDMFGAI